MRTYTQLTQEQRYQILIRQYFPKGCDFTTITDKDIQSVMNKLNNRPRKFLGMKTPNQVFFGINPPRCTSELNPRNEGLQSLQDQVGRGGPDEGVGWYYLIKCGM